MELKDLKVKKTHLTASEYLTVVNDVVENCIDEETGYVVWTLVDITLYNTCLLSYFDIPEDMNVNEVYELALQLLSSNELASHGINTNQWDSVKAAALKELESIEKRNNKSGADKFFESLSQILEDLSVVLNGSDGNKLMKFISKSLLANNNKDLSDLVEKLKIKDNEKDEDISAKNEIDPKDVN